MAKVIKDRVTGLSKGYGFVKYADVQMANNAINSMNGYRLEGRNIAVRIAGKPPQPTVPPGPPTSTMATYPVSTPPVGGYPSQQFMPGGSLSNPPPASYNGTPVPWGPPIPPPYASYAPYHPPPPGATVYPHVPGQPMPPYGVQYPPVQTNPPGDPTETATSSETQQQIFPPGVQSESRSSTSSASVNMYGSLMTPMPPNVQPAYATAPLDYSSYYNAVPPPPPPAPVSTVNQSLNMGDVPWAKKLSAPPPVHSAEKTAYGADSDYEKLMAEMK